MSHVDEGMLQALADGELPSGERRTVERHLLECEPCRAELDGLRAAARGLSAALGLLDHPVPTASEVTAFRVRTAARRPASRRAVGALPRVAVLLVGFAAAASATLPGSPVHAWLQARLGGEAGIAVESVEPAPAPAAAPSALPAAEAGVSVLPVQGRVRVVLRDAAAELRVRASLSTGESAGVVATGAAADARFSTGAGRIEVVGAGPGELHIQLPRAAQWATVEVNGRRYLAKEGDRLQLGVAAEDSSGTEVSFRVKP